MACERIGIPSLEVSSPGYMSVIFGLIVLSVDAYRYHICRHWTHSDTAQVGTGYLEIDYNSATEGRDRGLIGDLEGMNMKRRTRRGVLVLVHGRLGKARRALFSPRMVGFRCLECCDTRTPMTQVSEQKANIVSGINTTRLSALMNIGMTHCVLGTSILSLKCCQPMSKRKTGFYGNISIVEYR